MRQCPRVEVEALAWELVSGREQSGMVLDLSTGGLRLERPYAGGRTPPEIQVELELPEADEIIWARGQVCFDHIRRGPHGILRTTGIRLAAAASRDLRLLRDYVIELRRRREAAESVAGHLIDAACYARG
ncbi:MAG TPA: PilZ domain-containing protein [Kofleriaceae bacterium]|jgi:hypothetical protein|nr:PilZ domain-containing protein [Kofleriaceae bacterium]